MNWAAAAEGLALLGLTFPLAYGLGISTLWLVVPILWLSYTARPLAEYGIVRGDVGSLGFHLMMLGGVFVPYALGHVVLAQCLTGASFELRLPADFGVQILEQIWLIALPEEVFFRGYLQSQFDRASRRRWRVLGVEVGLGLPAAALLFAACHIVNGGPARLVTFFPGLWYGWLRARTGNVWVPALYHAASNLLMTTVLTSLD